MAEVRDDEDRIEIELVEHDPPRRRTRVAAPTPAAAVETEAAEPQPVGRSRRTVALVAGVGALGLLIGWATAKAGDTGGGQPESVAPATPPATSTAPPGSFADDPALVEPGSPRLNPASTAPRRTTTTTVPEAITVSPIPDVDPALVGLPYEIITEDGLGNVRFVDLASNTMTSIDGSRGSDVNRVFAGDGWLLVPNASTQRALLYRDGDPEPERISLPAPWGVLHVPGAEALWVPDDRLLGNQPGAMTQLDFTGEPTGVTVSLPAQPFMIDSTGAFLVMAPGGTYAVTEAGATKLTSGSLIAVGATTALAIECDDALTCGYVVIDRVSGARTALPDLFAGVRVESAQWWSQTTETISPDGTAAIVLSPIFGTGGDEDVVVGMQPVSVDLRTGTTTPISERVGMWPFSVQWTADSRYAFYFDNGEAYAYDRDTGEHLRAGPDERSTRRPQSFTVRPSDGTPWLER